MFAVFRSACKPVTAFAAGLGAMLFLSGCEPVPMASTGPSIDTSAPVRVALLVPGGSAQPGDAVLASSLENAARLAMSDLDGVRVDLRVYDTAGEAQTAAAAATRAVNEGARIILGPVYAQSANAVGLALDDRNINVLAFSNNTDIAGGNVFVLGQTFRNTANRLVRYAVEQGRGNIMIVHDRNMSGEAGAEAIRRAAAASGATIAGQESYEFSQNGVVAAVPTIVETAQSSEAQAIFFTADTSGALPLLTQLLPERGIDPAQTQFIGLTRWDIPPGTLELPGVQGGWFALPDPGLTQAFSQRYEASYGQPPHPIAGLAYDGIAAIGALVAQGNRDALTTSALTQPQGFAGVNGIFRLLPDGTNTRGLAVAEIQNSQVVVIDPAPRSFGGTGF